MINPVNVIDELEYDLIVVAVKEKSLFDIIWKSLEYRGVDIKKLYWDEPQDLLETR